MPTLARLASVLTKQVTLFADTPDESVTITYRPGAFAGVMEQWNALAERLNAAVTEEDAEAGLLDFGALFCGIVASWDLLEADGATPFALSPARITAALVNPAERLVFIAFMQTVVAAIAEDMGAGKVNGTPQSESSGATSSPMEPSDSSAASLNRSASSSSRAGSRARRRSNG